MSHAHAPAAPAASRRAPAARAEELLARFGMEAFRPGQREAVEAALEGRDSLIVMPTGGGKSLCYQLPALADIGLVVVVSPLIALMADQLRRLREAGVSAEMLASGMGEGHNERALDEIRSGRTRLVLAAPERFASPVFRRALAGRRVGLFVVDEAHCVTEWGHDFRPDYLRLDGAISALGDGSTGGGRPAVMALTATATPRVAEEIAARLGLRGRVSVRSGFDRPNLTFDVAGVDGKGAIGRKRAALLALLGEAGARPAIVYCGTRRDTEDVAARIAAEGIETVSYHAGMDPQARRESQAAFMEDRAEVVVATNAFGMGVDKADVRTVAHWALPTSLEAYYQEAGRAGRDGEPARALLLAARMDLGRLISFIRERETTVADVRRHVSALRARCEDGVAAIGHGELGERERVLLSIAERAGAVELEPGGAGGLLVRPTGTGSPRRAAAAIRLARNRAWESYRSIAGYIADGERCRRRQILDHFGDPQRGAPAGRCCDVCDPDPLLERALSAPVPQGRGRGPAPGRSRAGASQRTGSRAADGARDGAASPAGPAEVERFEHLRAWRWERAAGKPAYTVATDSVLLEVLRRQPGNVEALSGIRGIGPAFCRKHGTSLLAVLAAIEGSGQRPAAPPRSPEANPAALGSVPAPT
jgi:ATP-dependent DNA helicase RecQ